MLNFRILRHLAIALTVAVGALTAPCPIFAATHVQDQAQLTATANAFQDANDFTAQVFTAGMSGSLDEVDVLVGIEGTPGDLVVQVETVTGNPAIPSDNVLATALVAPALIAAAVVQGPTVVGDAWISVRFASPAQVVAQTSYAIVLSAASGGTFDHYFWGDTGGDPYLRGYEADFQQPASRWGVFPTVDTASRTFVVPIGVQHLSLQLDGVTGYAETPNSLDLNLVTDWTVEVWFKDDDQNGFNHDYRQIIIKGDRNANPEAPYFLLIGQNNVIAGVRTGGVDYPISLSLPSLGIDPKSWHHVAVTFQASLNVLNLWLDGRHIAYLIVPLHSSVGNSLPLEIGRNGPTTGKYWLGKVDDVRIWNIARKGTDISANYLAQLSGPQPGLVANWHFDDGSGTSAVDSTGNSHTATLNGGATFSIDVHT